MHKFRMPAHIVMVLALLVTFCTFQPSTLKAQSAGSIVGTVTDATGAVISAANVSLTNLGTNEKKTVQTDAAGSFRFVTLQPTQYKIEIEKADYKRLVKSPITVLVDATARVDAALEVGAASETVEVTTSAPLLQTESGTLGSQVEGKTVQEMPLNGRNTMNLIALVPGVVPQGSSQGTTSMNQGGHSNNSGWGNYQIGGSIAGHGIIFVDGAPNNALGGNVVGFVPTQDAIQEFKVATSAASPEFGRFAGGVVEMATKSGSNTFHASAYEYLRNTVLNANTYSNIISKTGRQTWLQNQYGATVTGPIWKDKAFFMFSWEGFNSRTGETTNTNIPDAGMYSNVAGVLSVPDSYNSNTGVYTQLKEPANFRSFGTGVTCITSHDTVAHRTYFNPLCLDPAAQILKTYFPDASTNPAGYSATTRVGTGNGNFASSDGIGDDNKQYNVRGDVNLSANQHLFVRFSKMNMKDIASDPLHSANGHNTANAGSRYATMQGVVGDTYTLNPSTIVDAHLSYMRQYSDNLQGSAGSADAGAVLGNLSKLSSSWTAITAASGSKQLPQVSLAPGGPGGPGGPDGLYGFRAMGQYGKNWYDTTAFTASVIKIKGNHTFKAGGEIRLLEQGAAGAQNPSSNITTDTGYTGDEWANFIFGLPSGNSINVNAYTRNYNWYQGYYGSDAWAVNRKLTINLGLRWELPGGVAEKANRGTVMLPDAISSTGIRGTLALVNSNEWRDKTTEPPLHSLLSPRLSFAYRVNSNTVVRGGYALTYLAPDMGTVLPSSSTVNTAATSGNNSSSAVTYTVANPFGATALNMPVGRAWGDNFVNTFLSNYANKGQSLSGPVPTTNLTYMQQWNLAVGQQLKGQQSIEASYAGALGVHLLPSGGSWSLDQPNSVQIAGIKNCETGNALGDTKCSNVRGNFTNFPAYQNVTNGNPYIGTMNYNSLQLRYEKRFGTGGQITSGYTMSKSLGDADTSQSWLDSGNDGGIQDYSNIKAEHSLLSFSMKSRWVTSYVLNLPFGKGKKYLNNLNGVLDRVVGGWAVNGITTLQSGQPLILGAGSNTYTQHWNAGALRPNYEAGCSKTVSGNSQARLKQWFNTKCFTSTPVGAYALGNESRVDSTIKNSGVANWDFSAQKQTKIFEKSSVDFRVEFFNVFNRRQWAVPSNSTSAGNFGQISAQQNAPRQIQASLRLAF